MNFGQPDNVGNESFDVTVCSPEWLASRCREIGIYDARHHLVVNTADFDERKLREWLGSRVRAIQADTWSEIGERLGRLGYWEFEDYTAGRGPFSAQPDLGYVRKTAVGRLRMCRGRRGS